MIQFASRTAIAGTALALSFGLAPASAADLGLVTKAPPVAAPAPASEFDVAFGSWLASDYYFRGISQSNRQPSFSAYVEPRYGWLYAGASGTSIAFPNRASAEIDLYGGIRPVFGPLALDFGAIYYAYPGGVTFNGLGGPETCTNRFFTPTGFCNTIKGDVSYFEVYGKATYTVNDNFNFGGTVYYSPNYLNFGADSTFVAGQAKFTAPSTWLPKDIGAYLSGEVGRFFFGRTDAFYGNIKLPEYTTWNVGIGVTYKVFTLDVRYVDSDLSRANCNVLTSDFRARFEPGSITPLNGSGLASTWCSPTVIAKLSADITLNTNIK